MMVRGKVRVGDLIQGTFRIGAPSDLRFVGEMLVDGAGNPVKTRPLIAGAEDEARRHEERSPGARKPGR
ncbi:MAG: hypothetical protein ABUR63_02240 [Verrucomicrobiota bacterium]